MAIETASELADAMSDLGLVEAARKEELRRLGEGFAAPRDLARQLLRRRWLTAFQANQLLQGKGACLRLGPYLLLERLGSGGMGEVFKAWHRRLHRLCAVKVIDAGQLEQPVVMQRFHREAEAAAQLSHPNIVAVHDAGCEGERHYLAMEYIDGIDLSRLLARLGPLPYVLACQFLAQAALGLHHAHELGFVHRDIKPPNILVAPRGGMSRLGKRLTFEGFLGATVKVLDMGLVRLQPQHLEATHLALTYHGVVIGTMDYLPPEQARNSHRVDRRADLYSLGCTLYHLLAGRPPFPGACAMDTLMRHLHDDPPHVGEVRPDVPDGLEAILRKLMAKRPEQRYGSAAEVAAALAPFAAEALTPALLAGPPLEGVPAGLVLEPTCLYETPPGQQETTALVVTPSRARPPRRRWGWVVGGVAVLLVLALLLVVVWCS